MNVNGLVRVVCALALATGCLAAQKPNIVIILADDLGYGDVGCYGAELLKTPNIDRLAGQGVRFTDAHSPAAVCQPSRYGVMAGRYNWRRGKPWDGTYMFSDKHPTLQQVLGKAGYATAAFGKWHNGWGLGPIDFNKTLSPGPLESGFDSYFGTPRTHNEPPQVFVENRNVYKLDPKDPIRIIEHNEVVERGLKDWGWGLSEGAAAAHAARPQDQVDLIVADRAADYLRACPKDQPFFLYVAFVAPHVPISPSEHFQGTSDAGQYGDFLQQLDASVGTVLDALKEQGFDKNTLVIFSSDNGAVYMHSAVEAGHHSNGNLLGQKTDAWCGGNQVPFIVRWPGKVPVGKTSNAFVSLTDIMATVTAAMGVETPETAIDSINQLPVILNPSEKSIRTEMIYTGIFGQGIYSDGWVYYPFQGSGGMTAHPTQRWGQPYQNTGMVNSDHAVDGTLMADAPPGQLYNVKTDPGQTTNIHNQHPERVETMKERFNKLIAGPDAPAGDGSTLSTGSSAPKKTPISWNGEVWGEPASVPAIGNHYIHDNKDVWLLALGQSGPFPGETLTLKNNASIWLTGGGPFGKGTLVLDGGQIQNRYSGRKAIVLGRVRVDSLSKILNIEGDLELKTGLSGTGDLSISAFQRSGTSVVINGPDQGYSGSFVLGDSAEDGVRLNVEFAAAFASAGLRFQNESSDRRPKLLLKNDLVFKLVQLPSAKNPGALIRLEPGMYDVASLLKAGVDPAALEDQGGTLTVGSRLSVSTGNASTSDIQAIVDDVRIRCFSFVEQPDVSYGRADGMDLKGDLFLPEGTTGKRPGVLMIHGGGWESGDKVKQAHFRKWAQDYARRGFVAFNINYRLAGTAKAPAAVEDAKCAVRFMHAQAEKWGLDPDRIVVTGGSAGSHLALMVGMSNDAAFENQGGWDGFSDRVAAVINRFGITDVTDVTYGKNPRRWAQNWLPPDTPGGKSLASRLSPLSYVGRKKLPPVFSFHGAEDNIIPVEQAMRLHLALLDHGHESELVIVPFCGHGFNLNRHRELTATLEEELDRRMIAFLIRSGVILKQTKTG